jgi:hypothetical protein
MIHLLLKTRLKRNVIRELYLLEMKKVPKTTWQGRRSQGRVPQMTFEKTNLSLVTTLIPFPFLHLCFAFAWKALCVFILISDCHPHHKYIPALIPSPLSSSQLTSQDTWSPW